MNRERLTRYLDYYVENEAAIHGQGYEGYKWEILRKIQCVYIPYKKAHIRNGIWDDDLEAFQSLVQTIYSQSGNLVYSSANSVLGRLLKYKPAELKALFQQLTGEGDRKDRMLHFVQGMEQLAQDDRISKSHKSFHSDFRSASFYLSFLEPEECYFYQFTRFKAFAQYIEWDMPPVYRTIDKYSEYEKMCEALLGVLKQKYGNLLAVYDSKTDGVCAEYDPCTHLLIQDIVFCYFYYKNHYSWETENKPIQLEEVQIKAKQRKNFGRPSKNIDYQKKQEMNRKIGEGGEKFVFENEKKLVVSYGFSEERVRHISVEEGDGRGYDILSCDEKGNDIYIEVKTTAGGNTAPFYITANELKVSEQYPDRYRLYRVINFKQSETTAKGKILVQKGSLRNLCIQASEYEVTVDKVTTVEE